MFFLTFKFKDEGIGDCYVDPTSGLPTGIRGKERECCVPTHLHDKDLPNVGRHARKWPLPVTNGGYNSSYPFIRPFIGVIYNPIYKDRRGPPCTIH